MIMLEMKNIIYDIVGADGQRTRVLELPELRVAGGESMVLSGPSGSGKTTLLNIIAGLKQPQSGELYFAGQRLDTLSAAERDVWRGRNIGYIFQQLNLLGSLTVTENLWAAGFFAELGVTAELKQRAAELLAAVGLSAKAAEYPASLSMGEQQRAAVARALLLKPPLILADEPTASLDYDNAVNVIGLLREMCSQYGAALLVSTHDESIKRQFGRRLELRGAGK